jgi:hypothetical protein
MTRPIRDLIVYCDRASDTARELARRLNSRRLWANPNRKLRSTAGSLCINYGTSHSPNFGLGDKSIILNPPEAVTRAISKRVSYEAFLREGVSTLDYTKDRGIASTWLQEGSGVLCRRDGLSGGNGIMFVPKGSQSCPDADFYTKYFPKTHEYRAHVVRGQMIDLTQKRLQNGTTQSEDRSPVEKIVRSLENGWVHAHNFSILPATREAIEKAAVAAVEALGLDFGAADILYVAREEGSRKPPRLAVCEVNTAPGLANEVTLNAYASVFRDCYNSTRDSRRVVVQRRRRIKKQVLVEIVTRKGNKVKRMRDRWIYEDAAA